MGDTSGIGRSRAVSKPEAQNTSPDKLHTKHTERGHTWTLGVKKGGVQGLRQKIQNAFSELASVGNSKLSISHLVKNHGFTKGNPKDAR
jgi:uncharacterized C2H2 Zn-finger protein